MAYDRTACTLLLALVLGTFGASGIAAEEASSTGGDTTSSPQIKGGVVQIDVTMNDIRDARLATSRVRKAAANLYDEVTRQQVTMSYTPNMVGTTVISVPTPSFSGQLLPARRKWVKASMSEIGPTITLLKEDVDTAIANDRRTDVSDSTQKTIDPVRDEAFALVKTSFDKYKELEGLTSGMSYDNNSIAEASKSLDSQMKQLDRSLKKGLSILQKEAKTKKKSKPA